MVKPKYRITLIFTQRMEWMVDRLHRESDNTFIGLKYTVSIVYLRTHRFTQGTKSMQTHIKTQFEHINSNSSNIITNKYGN